MKRRLGGDKSLTETQMVCLLWPMVSKATQPPKHTGVWTTYLTVTSSAFIAGGKEAERMMNITWAKPYIVEDPGDLDTATLRAYIPFARTVANLKRIPLEDSELEYETLAAELGSRPDLHPLHRQALRLCIATRNRLLSVCSGITA